MIHQFLSSLAFAETQEIGPLACRGIEPAERVVGLLRAGHFADLRPTPLPDGAFQLTIPTLDPCLNKRISWTP